MGVKITELMHARELSLDSLNNKVVAIDAYNHLYQFLSSIRGRDGSLMKNSKGEVTSHLIGLFSRTTYLLSKNIKPVYVFDGKTPKLKKQERERRKKLKIEAKAKYEQAAKEKDVKQMKKFASRTSRLTPEMIEEAKKLLSALGIPVITAPSEGEAQAAHMTVTGKAYAVASQDADALLFGAKRIIRNLSANQRKKMPGTLKYVTISPQLIDYQNTLQELGLSRTQLISLAMLVGTDYNPKGIKGIGPKTALKLVREHGNDQKKLFEQVKWTEQCDVKWEDIFDLFMNMPVTDDYQLEWKEINESALTEVLVEQHEFSEERVANKIEKLREITKEKAQQGLNKWF